MRNVNIGIRGFVFLLLILFLQAPRVSAQSQEKVYASMILNFARGIQWPMNVNSDNFVIGVVGYPPLADELLKVTQVAKVNGKKVEIQQISHPESIEDCNVLFVPAYKAKQIPGVLKSIGDYPTLVVTNKTDYAKKTGGINLVLVNGKLQYEINTRSIEGRGMKISSALKAMGIIVN